MLQGSRCNGDGTVEMLCPSKFGGAPAHACPWKNLLAKRESGRAQEAVDAKLLGSRCNGDGTLEALYPGLN